MDLESTSSFISFFLLVLLGGVKVTFPSFQIPTQKPNPRQCVEEANGCTVGARPQQLGNSRTVAALQTVALELHQSRQLARPNLDTLALWDLLEDGRWQIRSNQKHFIEDADCRHVKKQS